MSERYVRIQVDSWRAIGLRVWFVVANIALGGVIASAILYKQFPKYDKVEQGHIAPSRLDIECTDLNRNGELETILKIDNRPYRLKEADGKPYLESVTTTALPQR